jgi:ABC-type Zn uptake system ZnuABC Zn-binding protein ZnuA
LKIGLTEEHEEHEEQTTDTHDHRLGDPHIWLNPVLAKIQVQNIANAFSNSDPENRDFYQTNAAAYIKQLDSLD